MGAKDNLKSVENRKKKVSETINGEETENSMPKPDSKEKAEPTEPKHSEKKKKKTGKSKSDAPNPIEESNDNSKLSTFESVVNGISINVTGKNMTEDLITPLNAFEGAKLNPKLLNYCKRFERPSPIQAHAWPSLIAKRDFIGIAATGSGKTLAFAMPALNSILKMNSTSPKNPFCLVLAPTRELAQQISGVMEEVGNECNIKTVCIYGGASKGPQRAALKNKPACIVATPGRLMDFMEEQSCDLSEVKYVVLDEADRMLDLGFEPAIRQILKATPSSRQTVMLSATWPTAVENLANEFIINPVKVVIGSTDLSANHDVKQIVEVIEDRAKDNRLHQLLNDYHKSRKNRVLVFVLYKKEATRVENALYSKGWKAVAIHGDKNQTERNNAVLSFKEGKVPLLIATDVAARGLDIPEVEYVINYTFPLTTEDYVHRIGRTGRAGKKGTAHTFFTLNDKARSGELINVLKEANQEVPDDLLKFGTTVKKKESKLYGAHFREIGADAPKAKKIKFDDSDEE